MYQAFLSHNSADKPGVEELARRLEKDGITCFLDKWHLIPGEPWQPALEQALDESESCVVFVGPSGLGPWQNEEMRAAISRRVSDKSRSFRVVPVVLPGAQREQRSRLPTFLVSATWVEFTESLDDEDAYHRLKCGIRGIPPGPSPHEALYSGECPYRGLRVFDVQHASFFFGRDAQIDWMIERLAGGFGTHKENRFLGVVGASGSGKSSLVRAGLIPALREGRSRNGKAIPGSTNWPIVILKPGTEPLKALADALWSEEIAQPVVKDTLTYADQLKSDERRLHATIGTVLHESPEARRFVIVIDQFEELFTACPVEKEKERAFFIDNLLYASSVVGGRTLVLITMRADFYGKCTRYERLANALSEEQELVPPLGQNELRVAIEQPARLCGLELEAGLTDILVHDMREQPAGALPLLQQTLLMLWDRRDGHRITVAAYKDIGGIEGALEVHADNLYDKVLRTHEEREACRRVLMMLTTPGEGTEDTRRRVNRDQLAAGDTAESVLQTLAKGRLITISETEPVQIEVAHEALIRGWPKLQGWLDEDRESLRVFHRLGDAAGEWQSNDRDPAFLYRGSRLFQAEEWAEEHADELSDLPSVRAFLNECISQRDREKKRREDQEQQRLEMLQNLAEAERKKAATFRRMLIVAGCAAVTAVVLAIVAGNAKKRAERAQADAQGLAAEACLRNAGTSIRHKQDVSNGILWYAQALRTAVDTAPAARFSARSLIGGWSRSLPRYLLFHDDSVNVVSFSPDGRALATASDDGTARLWDAATGQPRGELKHDGPVLALSFSSDGRTLATASHDRAARLWDVMTGEPRSELLKHDDDVNAVSFSPDGQTLATASGDGTARLWRVVTGEPRSEPLKHDDDVNAVSFSRDGQTLATASDDETARLWDAATGQPRGALKHDGPVLALSFSPDGRTLATASFDGRARLWDVATGQPRGEPLKHDDSVRDVSFSPDGGTLATASWDKTARLWEAATGRPRGEPLKHDFAVLAVAFSPDGRTLATASFDGTAWLWDAATGQPRGQPLKHDGMVRAVSFSPDSGTLVTASDDGTARLWDAATGQPRGEPLKHEDMVWAVSFSPDGGTLATASEDRAAWLWDAATGQPRGEPLKHGGPVFAVSFSSDGGTLASAGDDGTARLWDVATGQPRPIKPLKHGAPVRAVSFSPDGGTLATASDDKTARLWDATTGQPRGVPLKHDGRVWAVSFSPDGRTLATASSDRRARLWDVATGQHRSKPLKHDDWVRAVSFSPDGQTLATASEDWRARLWDAATGQARGEPLKHDDSVRDVSFSPDGRTLATGSEDGTARLWDAATGQLRGEPLKHDGPVRAVSFSPDGGTLATGNNDGTVRLWDVAPPVVDEPERVWLSVEVRTRRTIENGLVRTLTQAEWLDRKRQLDALGGDCLNRSWDDLSEQEREQLRTPAPK